MTEITDEMVERGHAAYEKWLATHQMAETGLAGIREALNAALNPPPEPEITVTSEMRDAGFMILNQAKWADNMDIPAAYRAMRKLEPKP